MTAVGMNMRRRDAEDKAAGRTVYASDIVKPRMLAAGLLRSPIARGRITKIDVSQARAIQGVRAILTAADFPGLYGVGIADHRWMADGEVRYVGEPIVAIAADAPEIVEAAIAAISIEFAPEPPVVTMAQALRPDAPLLHPHWNDYKVLVDVEVERGKNIAWQATVLRGDVDAEFARPDVRIVETHIRVGRQNQASLEPRACVVTFQDNRFIVETSTQVPWAVRNWTATILGVDPSQVRVIVPPVGGGFGMKFEVGLEPYAAALARATGRPVRLVNSRADEMATALCRENAEIRLRSAITPEGRIAAREGIVLMDCGAYSGEQPFLTTMIAHTLFGNYELENARLVSQAVYTNTAPTGAFRACSGTYCTFALERHTDEICTELAIDPDEFRARNVLRDGSLGSTGQVFEGSIHNELLETIIAMRPSTPPAAPAGWALGRGLAVGTWFVFVGPSAATINLNADGSATLVAAGVEIGSGSTVQAIPQIVADTLGIAPELVVVMQADTDASGYDVGVGGGRTTVSLGSAALLAAEDVRAKLLDAASDLMEVAASDLEVRNGVISVVGDNSMARSVSEVVTFAQGRGGPLIGNGAFTARGSECLAGCAAGHMIDALDIPIFTVHECDVAVDPATGMVLILDYRVAQDVGRAINPDAIRGQIQGGVAQGIGYALTEEITIAADGSIEQKGFGDYRLPIAGDVPEVHSVLHEGAPSYGPFGAKGAGEIPIMNVAAAIGNAIAAAIGAPINELPMTPPRVLAAAKGGYLNFTLEHLSANWDSFPLGDLMQQHRSQHQPDK
jgi:CO/xanthine dehydrogenase Mo-binding subunit